MKRQEGRLARPKARTSRHGTSKQRTHRSLSIRHMELLEALTSPWDRSAGQAGRLAAGEWAQSARHNQDARIVGDVFVNCTTLLDASSSAGGATGSTERRPGRICFSIFHYGRSEAYGPPSRPHGRKPLTIKRFSALKRDLVADTTSTPATTHNVAVGPSHGTRKDKPVRPCGLPTT